MYKLYTTAGENLRGTPWNVYPRPQLRRDSFLCLNGEWDFAVNSGEEPASFDRKILVPFPPESLLSGVHERFSEDKTLWYRRTFALPKDFRHDRVIIHFGAVDQICEVYINGSIVAEHIGGYHAFSADITEHLKEENTILVRVNDNLSNFVLPYGKQCQKRGGMWYTPVSGIWQTVWLESVPDKYIKALKINTCENIVTISVRGIDSGTVTVGDITAPVENGKAKITIPEPHFWSPDDPYLYTFTARAGADRVESYFALRDLEIKEVNGIPRLCLNGKPYFFHGLLDQGYYSDGIFTPAVPEEYERDILRMKKLGFNMLRKHIKVEPEQFYYDCDRLGMVVFQDMVNNGNYNFFRDTALPTVGFKCFPTVFRNVGKGKQEAFIREAKQTVHQLYNHPSICYWTIFNEGWGQFSPKYLFNTIGVLDGSRFIDTTSGWFRSRATDVDSHHIYFRKIKLKAKDKPLVLSEFGGYTWKPKGHVTNTEKNYGYKQFKNREEFVNALQSLYREEVLPLVAKGLCATVYTQVSDVEDETNGLVSYDRKVEKVTPDELLSISEEIKNSID